MRPTLRRLLPRSLFARTLIIVVAPMLLLQAVVATVYFEAHLERVNRRMAVAVAGDLSYLAEAMGRAAEPRERDILLARAGRHMRMAIAWLPGERLPAAPAAHDPLHRLLARAIDDSVSLPFIVESRPEDESYRILLGLKDGVIEAVVPYNRFRIGNTSLVAYWMLGSSVLLLAIAILFLRNQMRPIRRLAEAAERFGKGQEVTDYRPAGASEIRQAGRAFVEMAERIRRQIRQRTEMLAGVSHDLRTPLTRMKLQLAMLPAGAETADLKADVAEMERMVDGYLAFARGADGEAAQFVDVTQLVNEAALAARREGAAIEVNAPPELKVWLKPQTLRRCLANLIDNACRYAKHTTVSVAREPHALLIAVEDDGPGIPRLEREAVFRPFYRLENSRNKDTGGVGLGLAIARDAIRSHGGDVTLEDAAAGGLRAVVRLPL